MPVRRLDVAVIGAGLAGLTAARRLDAAGHDVTIFEKSRGAGGRTATRRSERGRFDHGAPFLHGAEGLPGLTEHVVRLADGARLALSVGAGANNAPAKALAAGLALRPGVRVGAIAADGRGWRLHDEDGSALGRFDAVVLTAPAPQAAVLLREPAPELAERADAVAYAPCWAAMAAWDAPLGLDCTAVRDAHGLAWAVAEAPKPGREPGERWVLQADAARSEELLEATPETVGADLLGCFAVAAGSSLPAPAQLSAHRWRYSRPRTPFAERLLRLGTLVAAGDWCGGDDAGAAIRSGAAAAAALVD